MPKQHTKKVFHPMKVNNEKAIEAQKKSCNMLTWTFERKLWHMWYRWTSVDHSCKNPHEKELGGVCDM